MHEDIVVAVDWLADHREEVRIVDVRDEWEFDGIGHVPGAVNIPFDRFRSTTGDEGMLPGGDVWRDLMEEAGITPEDTLVAYDDTHGVFAARFLVTAMLYGHHDLHLLDGDYSAWSQEHETTREATPVGRSTYEVTRPEATPLVDYEFVLDAIDSDRVIVDTREAWEFEEGHVPGAVQQDWREFVDEETRGLKPDGELRAILESNGIVPETPVLLYCNTARRISHTYVVLQHLGFEDVAFYEGSLTEWDERGGPVERGGTDEAQETR